MEQEALASRIDELLADKLAGTDVFPVEVKVLPGARIEVYLDSDSGLTIKQCAAVSRFLELHLETEKLVPDSYKLEVSSPGVGQPLKLHRQYLKNIGRMVEVTVDDGNVHTGKLEAVSEADITITWEEKDKETKKKAVRNLTIPTASIKQTKVIATF
jgi:ribosome maturation factor RimP